jgi:hypothetical protein
VIHSVIRSQSSSVSTICHGGRAETPLKFVQALDHAVSLLPVLSLKLLYKLRFGHRWTVPRFEPLTLNFKAGFTIGECSKRSLDLSHQRLALILRESGIPKSGSQRMDHSKLLIWQSGEPI